MPYLEAVLVGGWQAEGWWWGGVEETMRMAGWRKAAWARRPTDAQSFFISRLSLCEATKDCAGLSHYSHH